ncbi:tropomyosin-like [Montipora foliosa]|uniref:tropomyosin-like n=1 Tax=Montipora foliosa TaxID=591990 RepID=UPI0035F11C05
MATENLREKMAQLKARLDLAEARSEDFKQSLNEVNGQIDSAEATAASLRRQATQTEVDIQRISARLDDVEGQLQMTSETLQRNEDAMAYLSKEEELMTATQNAFNEKLENIKQTVIVNETKLDEARQRIKSVELQKKLAEKRCERLYELEENLNSKLGQINKYIDELQSSSRMSLLSEEEEATVKEKIKDLRNTYRESEERAEHAQRKIDLLNRKRNTLEKQLDGIIKRKTWAQDELNKVFNEFSGHA